MLDRFNFYDIYGYIIPGLVLLTLLSMPLAITTGITPDANLGTALLYVLIAYVIGHVLHRISSPMFRHRTAAHELLRPDNGILSPWTKKRVLDLINERFGLDLGNEGDRREAFYLCRAALVQGKAARYLEQFQSLYVAMRHLATALVLGACFTLGWVIHAFGTVRELPMPSVYLIGIVLLGVTLSMVFGPAKPRAMWARAREGAGFLLFCVGLAVFGFIKAQAIWASCEAIWTLVMSVLALLAIHKLLLAAYAEHSDGYAREVFMSFITMETNKHPAKES